MANWSVTDVTQPPTGKAVAAVAGIAIIEEAKKRKQNRSGLNKSAPDKDKPFEGRSMAMIFEKPSTRTRMSFDIAVKQLGGSSIILNPDGIHYGKGEKTLKDTAKVLSEYVISSC